MRVFFVVLLGICFVPRPVLAEPTWEEIEKAKQRIEAQEAELQKQYEQVQGEYGTQAVVERLREFERTLQLTPEEYKELRKATGGRRGLVASDAFKERVAPVVEYVDGVNQSWSRFQTDYDALEMERHSVAADELLRVAGEVRETVAADYPEGSKQRKAFEAKYDKLVELHRGYQERKDSGTGPARDASFYSEFQKLIGPAYDDFMGEAASGHRSTGEKFTRFFDKVRSIRDNASFYGRVAAVMPTVLRKGAEREPGFATAGGRALRSYMRGEGYEMRITGGENVPQQAEPGVIHILPTQHMNANMDAVATGLTPVPEGKKMIMSALSAWVPGTNSVPEGEQILPSLAAWVPGTKSLPGAVWLSTKLKNFLRGFEDKARNSPDFLPVLDPPEVADGETPFEKYPSPIQATIERREGPRQQHSMIVQPEANLGTGLVGGSRPVQEAFTRITLGQLRKKNYGLSLTPVTLPKNHRTRSDTSRLAGPPAEGAGQVNIQPTVEAPLVDMMFLAGEGGLPGLYIRQAFIEDMAAKNGGVAGTLPLREAMDNVHAHVVRTNLCKNVYPAIGGN